MHCYVCYRYVLVSIIQCIVTCATGMYWYLSKVSSETQTVNFGYLSPGQSTLTWAFITSLFFAAKRSQRTETLRKHWVIGMCWVGLLRFRYAGASCAKMVPSNLQNGKICFGSVRLNSFLLTEVSFVWDLGVTSLIITGRAGRGIP